MKLKPLSDRVVIKVIEAEEKTASGIVLPDKAKEKPQEGEVVAVGDGRVLDNGTAWKWMWLLVTAYFSPNMPERRLK